MTISLVHRWVTTAKSWLTMTKVKERRSVEMLASADLAAQRVQADYTRSLMAAAAGFRRGAAVPQES